MAIVRLKDLKPGMVLASHARDSNGRLLLTLGEEITPKHIRTFKAWGFPKWILKVLLPRMQTRRVGFPMIRRNRFLPT